MSSHYNYIVINSNDLCMQYFILVATSVLCIPYNLVIIYLLHSFEGLMAFYCMRYPLLVKDLMMILRQRKLSLVRERTILDFQGIV